MSTDEPLGRGSRPTPCACPRAPGTGRTSVGWTSSTNGRVGMLPAGDGVLRGGDLGERSRRRAPSPARAVGGVAPRDRPVQRPVDLEHARPVAEAARAGAGTGPGSRSPAIASDLARRHVEQDRPRRRQLGQGADPVAGHDLARRATRASASRASAIRPAPAAGERPADGVGQQPEDEPERGRQRRAERQHRVRGHARRAAPAPAARGRRAGPAPSPGAAQAGRSAP